MLTAESTTTCPAPGVYPGVSFEEYRSWPALNNSGLTHFLISPAHYKASLDEEDDDTKDKTRGSICHAGILEPGRFEGEYAIGPCVKLNTKEGKATWEAFTVANPGKVHVRGEDGAAMLGCREAIWNHPEARRLLAAKGPTEISLVWQDAETGVMCKCRCDKFATRDQQCDYFYIVDLKTTRNARPRQFAKSIYEFGTHRQAAFNLRGVKALGLPYSGFAVIAVEKDQPHGLIVYDLIHCLDQGEIEVRDGIRAFAACEETGNWPCYPTAVRTIRLPKWAGQDDFDYDDSI